MTSRIKQAISSVQLFVQRCLMGLEKNVSLDEETAKQWKWMKNYRVWEANRKVFLYPENWIEPELRDDKSPFFKDLENELLQNEITLDTAETAFRNYLEKLDNVARLEICGMYWETKYDSQTGAGFLYSNEKVLHVFGRTMGGEPYTYYYRRWINSSLWTPWEKINLDIQGEHFIPVMFERRLRIFWPVFLERTLEQNSQADGQITQKYWEIKIAWSEYKNGKWSPKKISNGAIKKIKYQELNETPLINTNWRIATSPIPDPQSRYAFLVLDSNIDPFVSHGGITIYCFEKPQEIPGPVINDIGYAFRDLDTSIGSFVFSDDLNIIEYDDLRNQFHGQTLDVILEERGN